MKHKTAVRIAVVMIVVFGAISILYPRIFAPKAPTNSEDQLNAPNVESVPTTDPASAPPVAAPPPAGP